MPTRLKDSQMKDFSKKRRDCFADGKVFLNIDRTWAVTYSLRAHGLTVRFSAKRRNGLALCDSLQNYFTFSVRIRAQSPNTLAPLPENR
jgi:hypothetical protein